MSPVRIIGVGSPIGNDQAGWQAIDALQTLGLATSYPAGYVTLEKLDRPGASLLQHMRGADLVIIIDALINADKPDQVMALRPSEIIRQTGILSGHGLGVAEVIALGDALGDLPSRLLLLGITVEQRDNLPSNQCEIKPEILTVLQRHICQEIKYPVP